jgi:SAM-dependent methyltransferase
MRKKELERSRLFRVSPLMPLDSKDRFSDRAGYYAKYRPSYPHAIVDFMKRELGFLNMSVVADVGSGTGILSEMFLRNGNPVYGVEPNEKMRDIAKANLGRYSTFTSINGSAEATSLPAASIDFVTAAQSFHWFDRVKTRVEFSRILKPEGWVLLVWNTRRKSTPIMQEYQQLVSDYADSQRVSHESLSKGVLRDFLGEYKARLFDNVQVLDLEGLTGRLLSSSYVPLANDPRHKDMLDKLHEIFIAHQKNGVVQIEYDTEVYCSQLV